MQTLEPREVEKPFYGRWLKGALRLMLRCPLRFGALIAVLACIDTTAARHLKDSALPQKWFDWLGLACLPALWTLVAAMAKGADDRSQTWPALRDFARGLSWYRALRAGLFSVGLILLASFLLKRPWNEIFDPLPGQLLSSFAAQCWICWTGYGLCYFPLLVFLPGLTGWELSRLSRKAESVNREQLPILDRKLLPSWAPLPPNLPSIWLPLPIWFPLFAANLAALFIEKFLSYGIAAAAWLVYSGIVSYVAYKDIFERRPVHLVGPASAAAGEPLPAHTATVRAQRIRTPKIGTEVVPLGGE